MKDRLLLLVVIALLAGLGFVATQIVFTYDAALSRLSASPAPAPTRTADATEDDLTAMLATLPPDGNVVSVQRLPESGRLIAVKFLPQPDDPYRRYPMEIWYLQRGNAPQLVHQRDIDTPYTIVSYEFAADGIVVKTDGSGDGPFGYGFRTQDLLDPADGRWIAGTYWEDYFGTAEFQVASSTMNIRVLATNDCRNATDSYGYLSVNDRNIPFKKKFPLTCRQVCEGECEGFPPGIGEPAFSNETVTTDNGFDARNIIEFKLPWEGGQAIIDLVSPTSSIHSADFAKEYPFREESPQ